MALLFEEFVDDKPQLPSVAELSFGAKLARDRIPFFGRHPPGSYTRTEKELPVVTRGMPRHITTREADYVVAVVVHVHSTPDVVGTQICSSEARLQATVVEVATGRVKERFSLEGRALGHSVDRAAAKAVAAVAQKFYEQFRAWLTP